MSMVVRQIDEKFYSGKRMDLLSLFLLLLSLEVTGRFLTFVFETG